MYDSQKQATINSRNSAKQSTQSRSEYRALVSRRQFLQVSGAGLASVLLTACAAPAVQTSGSEGTGAAAEPITLQVLNANWGELYNGLMENIGKDYMAANPNVEVAWTFEGEWKTKLLTQVAGGTPPMPLIQTGRHKPT